MEYVLQTNALEKSYGHYRALKGLTMSVPKGQIYGLVGKNGAGKTTLIRLICGLQRPTGGGYFLYGIDSKRREIGKARRRIGAVVEAPSIYLDMTAKDNLRVQCRILGLPSFAGIGDVLKTVGLADTGRKRAKDFSLGMRQRLGIAVAIVGDPDFLILDEPANGLDPQGIVEMREIILRLNRERGITVLLSSHILDELSRLATCYGFIDGGRMVKEIGADELHGACRKCLRVTVSDVGALSRALEELGLEYTILSGHEADIFGEIGITRLVNALSRENCEVFSAKEHDETLEHYYINLVGGGDNV